MVLRTTLFEAVTVSHYLQLAGRDVERPVKIRDGKLSLSLGQDEDWVLLNQEIEIDNSGESQVQARNICGDELEIHSMRFYMSHPLAESDLKPVK